jgi:hypothetical protein
MLPRAADRPREARSGHDPGSVAAASTVGREEVLVAARAARSPHDAPGIEPRRFQAPHRVPGKVDVRPGPGAGTHGGGREALRDLGTHLEAAGSDGRSEDGVERPRVLEGGQRRLHDAAGEAAPARVDDGDAFPGRGQDQGETVRGAHGERRARIRGAQAVAGGGGARSRNPLHAGSVDLLHGHGAGNGGGRGVCAQGPRPDAEGAEAGRKRRQPHDDHVILDAPAPLHDGRA